MKLVFASSNKNKVREVAALMPSSIELLGLPDIQCTEEIPETSPTIKGNALQKARFIYQKFGYDCFADDTGLEVSALNNEPGVFSARYAGEEKNAEANMNKLLVKLREHNNRSARFITVIALIINGEEHFFEGTVNGKISDHKQGKEGFGYDPVFVPEGHDRSFAEMPVAEKNKISHRAIAINKLCEFLKTRKS